MESAVGRRETGRELSFLRRVEHILGLSREDIYTALQILGLQRQLSDY